MSELVTIAQLLSEYRDAADQTTSLSDVKKQNAAADKVHVCYKKLRESSEGRRGIAAMMSDPSPGVREWAAAHTLQWEPEQARRVLEGLRDEAVFPHSLNAEMVLAEFDDGSLLFDY